MDREAEEQGAQEEAAWEAWEAQGVDTTDLRTDRAGTDRFHIYTDKSDR